MGCKFYHLLNITFDSSRWHKFLSVHSHSRASTQFEISHTVNFIVNCTFRKQLPSKLNYRPCQFKKLSLKYQAHDPRQQVQNVGFLGTGVVFELGRLNLRARYRRGRVDVEHKTGKTALSTR